MPRKADYEFARTIAVLAYYKGMDPRVLMDMDPMFLDLFMEFFSDEMEARRKR